MLNTILTKWIIQNNPNEFKNKILNLQSELINLH